MRLDLFKKKKIIKDDSKIIEIIDGKIPYNKVENENKISFIIIAHDEKSLKQSIESIANIYKEHKEKKLMLLFQAVMKNYIN